MVPQQQRNCGEIVANQHPSGTKAQHSFCCICGLAKAMLLLQNSGFIGFFSRAVKVMLSDRFAIKRVGKLAVKGSHAAMQAHSFLGRSLREKPRVSAGQFVDYSSRLAEFAK